MTVFFFFFCALAAIVQRVSGFGFGIVIMTVLPYIMPTYGEATTLSGLLAMMTSIMVFIKLWRQVCWAHLLPILCTFLVVSFFAVLFVSAVNEKLLKHILGVILILVSLYFLFVSGRIVVRPTHTIQITMGTISGMMGGFCGMQGPPAILYFLQSEPTKQRYLAIAQTYFLIGNLCMTFYRAANGFLTTSVGYYWCIGIIAVISGSWIGGKIFERISLKRLRYIVYIYMCISGIVAILA